MICPICSTTVGMSQQHWHAIDKYDVEYTCYDTYVWFFGFHDSKKHPLVLRFKSAVPLTLERIEKLLLLK